MSSPDKPHRGNLTKSQVKTLKEIRSKVRFEGVLFSRLGTSKTGLPKTEAVVNKFIRERTRLYFQESAFQLREMIAAGEIGEGMTIGEDGAEDEAPRGPNLSRSQVAALKKIRSKILFEGASFSRISGANFAERLPKTEADVGAFIRERTRLYFQTWVLSPLDRLIAAGEGAAPEGPEAPEAPEVAALVVHFQAHEMDENENKK